MAITREQVRSWIQAAADAYGGIAEYAFGTPHQDGSHGSGWRGEYGEMTLSMCAGMAVAASSATPITVNINEATFFYNHNLGRVPLVQVYNNQGRIVAGSLVKVTGQQIIITGTIGGTLVYI